MGIIQRGLVAAGVVSSQMADRCLGTSVGQTGVKDGELWQMDTERNETH